MACISRCSYIHNCRNFFLDSTDTFYESTNDNVNLTMKDMEINTLEWVAVIYDALSNDSRFNNARFTHNYVNYANKLVIINYAFF